MSGLMSLSEKAKHFLYSWIKLLPSQYFIRIVDVFQHLLSFAVQMSLDSQMVTATYILADLCMGCFIIVSG